MNILVLLGQWQEAVSDSVVLGLVKLGFSLGNNLIVYPLRTNLFTPRDHMFYYGLPVPTGRLPMQDAEGVRALLVKKFFDLVIMAGIWQPPYMRSMYEHILSAMTDEPCAVISETKHFDDIWVYRDDLNIVANFYREKYPDWDGFPITAAIMEERLNTWPVPLNRKLCDTFYAGRRTALRDPYTDALIKAGYANIFQGHYSSKRSDYLAAVRSSRVTFCFPGTNYNLGTLLRGAAQRTCMLAYDCSHIIEIRKNFTHDVNAIYFNGVDDMLSKLESILKDEQKLQKIAEAGYQHVRNHHLVQHLAQYVLDTMAVRSAASELI